jgi:sarcosine oxidase subunit alpha
MANPSTTPTGGTMRLNKGGRVDRDTRINFTFDGKTYSGFKGDTLASALMANGVHLVGRSFKYHRPRGIMTAGSEEPNALIRLGRDARIEPNIRATQIEIYPNLKSESQNRWPSLEFDLGAVNSLIGRMLPAAFYYKTFKWPASMWRIYEHFIRKAAGLGRAATNHNDPDRYEKTNRHADVLVVGGGGAGLMAALSAGRSGARVIIADEQNEFGGWLLSENDTSINGTTPDAWVTATVNELAAMNNVTMLPRTTVFGYMDHNYLTMMERLTDHLAKHPTHLPRQRMWKIRAKEVVLAQGNHERPLVFGGNDLPGVMLSSAIRSYINRYGVIPGRHAVVVTNNDDAYRTAFALVDAGVMVRAIVDMRPTPATTLVSEAMRKSIEVHTSSAAIEATGTRHVGRIKVARINPKDASITDNPFYLDCDLVAMSAGFTPIVNLHSQARGKLRWDDKQCCFCPSDYHEAAQAAGAGNGIFDLKEAMVDGAKAGAMAASRAGHDTTPSTPPKVDAPSQDYAPLALWKVATDRLPGAEAKAFIDFQNDVTANDIKLAVREGYHSVEHVKRYTTNGMATDQGKLSNINALGIIADALDDKIPNVGTTTFRMPYTPASIGGIAGRDIKHLFDPIRSTRMDRWHKENGAEFEHVGQWMRAWFYPKAGESMQQAVEREVKAARQSAGLLDASTLGKIDIRGKDAAEFLNRIYTNAWMKLPVGRCRYGLMLKDDGMVMDDGVTSRLGENHFHMTTTTGGAAAVLDWLEEWHQTEWPELQVYMTSVTEQWSVATLSGPNAKKILQKLGCSIALDDDNLPFMAHKSATLAGLPVRIFRISFTGELSYEINTPARLGLALWKNLMDGGEEFGITPYGTEAMHVLRAEKGFIIVGQETDGSVTPLDLGMDWIVSKTKPDFIGKRALERASMTLNSRKQMVGLMTENPKDVIPEGAHAVLDPNQPMPMEMLGQVTSSYYSPNLGHSIAMALLKGGHEMMGETVYFPMIDSKKPIKATVTSTSFYDPKGEKLNG